MLAFQKVIKSKKLWFFLDKNDIRLKCMREIGTWIQDEWCPCIKKSPMNAHDLNSEFNYNLNQSNSENLTCDDNAHDESMHQSIESEEDFNEFKNSLNENKNNDNNCINKKGRKSLFGGPSEETIMALSHALNAFCDLIIYLLTVKGFKYVIGGKINNDPIEKGLA